MKESLSPKYCYRCDIGRVKNGVCKSCGADYKVRILRDEKLKKKQKSAFLLPTVREVNPTHLEKDLRDK